MTRSDQHARYAVSQLIADTAAHMETLRYAARTIKSYKGLWRKFETFAARHRCPVFSDALAKRFLASRGVPVAEGDGIGRENRLAMRALSEFSRYKGFRRLVKRPPPTVRLPRAIAAALTEYLAYCEVRVGTLRDTKVRQRRLIEQFLTFVAARGRRSLDAIDGEDISAFVRSRSHFASKTVAIDASGLRSFFRVGCVAGLLSKDISCLVPRVRIRPDLRIPAVWTREDIDAVLRAVDRASPVGKRDYSIILLACKLGMRAGDIRELMLDEILWDRGCISKLQGKTGTPLDVPLTNDVAEALIDYIRNGRPRTTRREVFLRMQAPFEPLGERNAMHAVLTRYRRLAGVRLNADSPQGLHSLRHTFASHLLRDGIPIGTISNILGHASIETTRIYTKVDIKALREVALPVEEHARDR